MESMDGFLNMKRKMKRKDLDQVNDDFYDFSLSSPARKIRRLDAELPPIMEDEDPEISIPFHKPSLGTRSAGVGVVIEELPTTSSPSVPVNDERAIVLFKPVNGPLLLQQSPTTMSVSVDPDLIAGFKNHFRQVNLSANERSLASDDEVEAADDINECKAVIPWIPSQFPATLEPQMEAAAEAMEDDEMGGASMEVEEDNSEMRQANANNLQVEMKGSDAFPQWQHCMTPQIPPATSSPIVWFR